MKKINIKSYEVIDSYTLESMAESIRDYLTAIGYSEDIDFDYDIKIGVKI